VRAPPGIADSAQRLDHVLAGLILGLRAARRIHTAFRLSLRGRARRERALVRHFTPLG
jgi:hypothetical protein